MKFNNDLYHNRKEDAYTKLSQRINFFLRDIRAKHLNKEEYDLDIESDVVYFEEYLFDLLKYFNKTAWDLSDNKAENLVYDKDPIDVNANLKLSDLEQETFRDIQMDLIQFVIDFDQLEWTEEPEREHCVFDGEDWE